MHIHWQGSRASLSKPNAALHVRIETVVTTSRPALLDPSRHAITAIVSIQKAKSLPPPELALLWRPGRWQLQREPMQHTCVQMPQTTSARVPDLRSMMKKHTASTPDGHIQTRRATIVLEIHTNSYYCCSSDPTPCYVCCPRLEPHSCTAFTKPLGRLLARLQQLLNGTSS